MSMRPRGKHVTIDEQNPQAVAICDYSGLIFNRKDLVRQMEWRGNRLAWTGFYVGRPYADTPNPQLKPPTLRPDPIPVREPRPNQQTIIYFNNLSIPFNLLIDPFNVIGDIYDGRPAIPVQQNLRVLNTTYFGAMG